MPTSCRARNPLRTLHASYRYPTGTCHLLHADNPHRRMSFNRGKVTSLSTSCSPRVKRIDSHPVMAAANRALFRSRKAWMRISTENEG
jgi:hypothetical protein